MAFMLTKEPRQCISELQCKARYFAKTGLVVTLNGENNQIIKSDTIVPETYRQAFLSTFDKLVDEYNIGRSVDAKPYIGDAVVNPWLYPYYYGTSAVFKEEVVGVADAVQKWAGKGSVWPSAEQDKDEGQFCFLDFGQPLPSNVAFNSDGSVKITSYVNNLHPEAHASAYPLLDRVITAALHAWDPALYGYARVEERIVHQWSGLIRKDELAQARFDIVPAID